LEEKKEGDSSSEDEDEDDREDAKTGSGAAGNTSQELKDSDIIGKLMGGKGKKTETDKPSIEEMTE
jgi:hypothetical protein